MGPDKKPILKDLILVGGGHSNIQVMKMFAMEPVGGLRVTLISDKIYAPYSGMLPGFLAGYYDFDQCHFDLPQLCQNYGFRFIFEKVVGIDPQRQKIQFSERHEISYDCASINVGVEPKTLAKSTKNIIPIKPISTFVKKWRELTEELSLKKNLTKIAVIGGGAAGVEMTLILMEQASKKEWQIDVHLFQRGSALVSKGDPRSHRKLMERLEGYGVQVHLNQEFNRAGEFDKVLLSSEAQAPHWFQHSNLALNDLGFLKVDSNLKAIGSNNLFAAGDCIHFDPSPLKKSGVYAVRQGKILAHNLRCHLLKKEKFKNFEPRKNVLSLIVIGPKKSNSPSRFNFGFIPITFRYSLEIKKLDRCSVYEKIFSIENPNEGTSIFFTLR